MPDLPWFFGPFKNLKSFQENFPLTFPVSHLPHRPSVRMFNGGRAGDAYCPMKFISGCENNGGKSSLLQEPGSQSDGLTAEGSGGGHEDCLDSFKSHPHGNRLHSFF